MLLPTASRDADKLSGNEKPPVFSLLVFEKKTAKCAVCVSLCRSHFRYVGRSLMSKLLKRSQSWSRTSCTKTSVRVMSKIVL